MNVLFVVFLGHDPLWALLRARQQHGDFFSWTVTTLWENHVLRPRLSFPVHDFLRQAHHADAMISGCRYVWCSRKSNDKSKNEFSR